MSLKQVFENIDVNDFDNFKINVFKWYSDNMKKISYKSIQTNINIYILPKINDEILKRKYLDFNLELQQRYFDKCNKTILKEDLETLRKIWLDTKQINKDYLIIGLFLFIEPKRTDFIFGKVVDDVIKIPHRIKVNKDTPYDDILIPNELKTLIHLFNEIPHTDDYENYTQSSKNFSKHIIKASNKIFNKSISINDYRKLWVKFVNKNGNNLNDRVNLANSMNHSIFTSMKVYERKY